MIIDLGCGSTKVPNAIGVDNVALPGVDIVYDLLEFPYPFKDNCANEIYLNHVIEHFALEDIKRILREVYRLLTPMGKLYIRVPHIFSIAAWVDPTHRMAFSFDSFHFFDIRADKAYYKSINHLWALERTTTSVTWFNWKLHSLRQIDAFFSHLLSVFLNWVLSLKDFPGSADLLVKLVPIFFVEIQWDISKSETIENDVDFSAKYRIRH